MKQVIKYEFNAPQFEAALQALKHEISLYETYNLNKTDEFIYNNLCTLYSQLKKIGKEKGYEC